MMNPRVLETERLILREWHLEDFEDFAAMHSDPRVMEFLANDGKPLSRFAAWQSLTSIVGHWALRGFGLFAVIERATGEFVGRVGPWYPEGWPDFEVGWTIRSAHWGKGYATEAARRAIDYSFTDLGRSHVVSLILPHNTRSIKVAQRLGEQFERDVELPHLPGKRVLQYGVHKHDWVSMSGAG